MKQTYLDKLEFYKIKEILEGFCATYVGKDLARTLCPSSDREVVLQLLKETTESHILTYRLGNPPISEVADITLSLKKLNARSVVYLHCNYLILLEF